MVEKNNANFQKIEFGEMKWNEMKIEAKTRTHDKCSLGMWDFPLFRENIVFCYNGIQLDDMELYNDIILNSCDIWNSSITPVVPPFIMNIVKSDIYICLYNILSKWLKLYSRLGYNMNM